MLHHLALGGAELSVAIVDDGTMRVLNRRHRGKDKPTDVLAFPMDEWASGGPPAGLLGDVILSAETARRQARRHRRPLLDEVTMLLAHGLLHLLGHDHRTDAEEREMTARTRELEQAAGARQTRRTGRR
jgi:probable rRNA maturation factor